MIRLAGRTLYWPGERALRDALTEAEQQRQEARLQLNIMALGRRPENTMTTPSQESAAAEVRSIVQALNTAVERAVAQGLEVKINIDRLQTLGRPAEVILSVRILVEVAGQVEL